MYNNSIKISIILKRYHTQESRNKMQVDFLTTPLSTDITY